MRWPAGWPLLLTVLFALGCPSAYQQTYERKTQELESEQRAREAEEKADRKSTRLNSSHSAKSRMPSSA